MRRIAFGILWFVVLYFVACFVIGAIAGGIAGSRDPANAAEKGREAGARVVASSRGYIFAGSVVLSVLGAWGGILPGTRITGSTKEPKVPSTDQPDR
jgi:hypothetical protein